MDLWLLQLLRAVPGGYVAGGVVVVVGPDVLLRFGSEVNDVEARLVPGDAVALTADNAIQSSRFALS